MGVQGIGRDVTERKRAEAELLRRNQELATLNEISHELSKLGEPAEIAQKIHSLIGKVLDNRNLYVALYDSTKAGSLVPGIHDRRSALSLADPQARSRPD